MFFKCINPHCKCNINLAHTGIYHEIEVLGNRIASVISKARKFEDKHLETTEPVYIIKVLQ